MKTDGKSERKAERKSERKGERKIEGKIERGLSRCVLESFMAASACGFERDPLEFDVFCKLKGFN